MIDSARKSIKKYDKRKYINGKPEGFTEDARYDSTPGGMEWGTDKGDNYFRSLTPGQTPKNRKAPLKPLPIKARKPEDEKQTWRPKVTENVADLFTGKIPKPQDRLKAGIKVDRSKYKSIKNYKASLDKKIDYDALSTQKEDFNMRYADPANFTEYDHIGDKQADHSKHQYPINNEVETFDAGDEGHWLTGKDGDWYIEQDDITALDKEAENYTFDNAIQDGLYDEEELTDDDYDNTPGFDNDIEITEVLSVQGRMKRRFNARRNKQKLRVARGIALRRGSTPDRLKKRATRGARLMVYKRLLRGRDRAGLPPAEKARLERMITRFAPLVQRISIKLLPQMRKNEIKRLTGRGKRGASTSKKYKAAKPVRSASSQKAKRYKIKSGGKYKAPKKPKYKSNIRSGGPTLKKASKSYKAFSYSVG